MSSTINSGVIPKSANLNDRCIFIFDATDGMVLSRDLYRSDGHLIATKNTQLDITLISKISSYHILEIHVYDTPVQVIPSNPNAMTYFEKVRNSNAYSQFSVRYMDNVSEVKGTLNDIMQNHSIVDTTKLLSGTAKLLSYYTNNLQLFDMLHCMRQFDDLTYVHCVNVALIASIIGKWLHFSQEDIDTLTLCGLLHDIGKLVIPTSILKKPGKLTCDEYAIMKQHVNLGYEHLKDQNIDPRIKEACLFHHEKADGSGYPFQMCGDKIPDFAKIVTIADIYDAMTSARVYRKPICPFEVISMMEDDVYTKFDPRFMLPFMDNIVTSYINNNVRLSNGQAGEVIFINRNAFSRPVIKCDNDFIDLSKVKGIRIVDIL
jgi:putative nucleotidyltransferase with HDIG domain